jgi:GNAT superfamily N-acetyltransferase
MDIIVADKSLLDTLIDFRFAYLLSEHELTEIDRKNFADQFSDYFTRHIGDDFTGFLARTEEGFAASIFMIRCEKPANFSFRNGHTAMLMNVYTKPEFRRRGIASKLLDFVIDYAGAQGISCIDLSATTMGRPLYEKHGFKTRGNGNSEMRLKITEARIQNTDERVQNTDLNK